MDSESWTTKCAKSLRSATFFEPFLIVDISFETHSGKQVASGNGRAAEGRVEGHATATHAPRYRAAADSVPAMCDLPFRSTVVEPANRGQAYWGFPTFFSARLPPRHICPSSSVGEVISSQSNLRLRLCLTFHRILAVSAVSFGKFLSLTSAV